MPTQVTAGAAWGARLGMHKDPCPVSKVGGLWVSPPNKGDAHSDRYQRSAGRYLGMCLSGAAKQAPVPLDETPSSRTQRAPGCLPGPAARQ